MTEAHGVSVDEAARLRRVVAADVVLAWGYVNVGAVAGLHRDRPVRCDAYRNPHGEPEPRLVWRYRARAEAGLR